MLDKRLVEAGWRVHDPRGQVRTVLALFANRLLSRILRTVRSIAAESRVDGANLTIEALWTRLAISHDLGSSRVEVRPGWTLDASRLSVDVLGTVVALRTKIVFPVLGSLFVTVTARRTVEAVVSRSAAFVLVVGLRRASCRFFIAKRAEVAFRTLSRGGIVLKAEVTRLAVLAFRY